jgi:enamine deaminase RidA (YjgF/YER057c/UK114 family)
MMSNQAINPDSVFRSGGHGFSQAIVASGRRALYVSGQTAWNKDRELGGGTDLGQQARQAFHNLRLVVEAAGGSLSDVVAVRVYIVAYRSQHAAQVGSAVREAFAGSTLPASTWIGVTALARPEFLVEVEATATLE